MRVLANHAFNCGDDSRKQRYFLHVNERIICDEDALRDLTDEKFKDVFSSMIRWIPYFSGRQFSVPLF